MSKFLQVRIIRQAISPRLAISIFLNKKSPLMNNEYGTEREKLQEALRLELLGISIVSI
mgnify:CR=1 FL=1